MIDQNSLIPWETRNVLRTVLEKEVDLKLDEYANIRLLNEEDQVELHFKVLYIREHLLLRIEGVLSTLIITDYDDLVEIARNKVNIDNTIEILDRDLVELLEEEGLETIIPNFSL